MEHITSRQNNMAAHLRRLGADAAYRAEAGLFLCDGEKLLREALACGAELDCVLWGEKPGFELSDARVRQFTCPGDLLRYVSPLKNTAGPVFSVKMAEEDANGKCAGAIVLENVQDPGNVGAVLRSAAAFGVDLVALVGSCADVYNPKTIRSSMGAIFRQRVLRVDYGRLERLLAENGLKLYGAALLETAGDIRDADLKNAAVAIGSEGSGLSERLLSMCDGQLIIPMRPGSESLNAAVAAAIVMWEMYKG